MMISCATLTAWLKKLDEVYENQKERLTELDSAIGDADHGVNMARGFKAVHAALAQTPPETIQVLFKTTAMTLIKHVGGASGPLYGSLFMKMIPLAPAEGDFSLQEFTQALHEGVEGVKKMGKSTTGEKTMLDAWSPAIAAMQESVNAGASDKEALQKAADAAEKGMHDTIPMLAAKGRASFLGERSIGHQDPGATSTWLMLKTLAECVQG